MHTKQVSLVALLDDNYFQKLETLILEVVLLRKRHSEAAILHKISADISSTINVFDALSQEKPDCDLLF